MSVFNTDSVTIVRMMSIFPKYYLENRKMLLIIAAETATVRAQEQRAKDAKSFRRLYASDENSMLIS